MPLECIQLNPARPSITRKFLIWATWSKNQRRYRVEQSSTD